MRCANTREAGRGRCSVAATCAFSGVPRGPYHQPGSRDYTVGGGDV